MRNEDPHDFPHVCWWQKINSQMKAPETRKTQSENKN